MAWSRWDTEAATQTRHHRGRAALCAIGAGEATSLAAWAEGRAMTVERAIAYALEEQPSG